MEGSERHIPVEWFIPEDMVPCYANNIVVQHTDNEFVISFFETFPPIVIGEPERVKEQIEELGSVRSRCVARIVVTPGKMEQFIGAMVQNYTRYSNETSSEENGMEGNNQDGNGDESNVA